MIYTELLSPVQLQKLIGGNAMSPFITVGSRTTCKNCGHDKFIRVKDDEDELMIPICAKCKIGKPKVYRVAFSLPVIGSNKFKKYLKSKNEVGRQLTTLTMAKSFMSYIENKIKIEGVNFDPRELGSEEERKIFQIEFLAQEYMEEQEKRLQSGKLTPGGHRKIERQMRLYIEPTFKKFHVKQITTPVIKREIRRLGISPSVATEMCKVLSTFMGYAVDMGLIQARPTMPIYEKGRRFEYDDFYTNEEQSLVIENIKKNPRRVAITMLSRYTLRECEIRPLTWGDVDFKRETVTFNKHISKGETKSKTKILPGLKSSPKAVLIYPFFPGLKALLMTLNPSLDPKALVFPNPRGKLLSANVHWDAWSKSVDELIRDKKLTKKVDLHRGTRSSTLSDLLERGYSIEELAELYGGNKKTMLDHYAKAKQKVQKVAHLWN